MSGYLFNMATIFEDFVTVALREALKSYGGRTSLQHVTHLDDDADVPVRPDFVWLTQGHPRIVVDAKYKAEKPTGFPQADLYQMFAYCTVLGLPEGDLVYATKPHAPDRSRFVPGPRDWRISPPPACACVSSPVPSDPQRSDHVRGQRLRLLPAPCGVHDPCTR